MAILQREDVPILQVEHTILSYRHGPEVVHAVNDVSLEIRAGSMTLFQGKSGSGKTTLLNIMGGLERPTSGRVAYRGREFAGFSRREMTRWRRHDVGFVFQSFALLPGLTAIENVDLAARIAGCGPREASERAEHYLRALGMDERAGHRVAELSGGEQQRVAVARGLVAHPSILFADEPTGELDHAMSRKVMDLLRSAVDETGLTVCLTSHDPAVRAFADHVYTLSDGRVVPPEA